MKLHPRLSAESVLLARRGVRLRSTAERDAEGWVLGYDHRASAREGARVGEEDATALLAYDLSRSAERLEPLLDRPTPAPMFDALNVVAWRTGPDAFARSDLLRRWNAGEALTAVQVLQAADAHEASVDVGAGEEPASAVLAAAEAVRDRLSRVLDAPPEPAPARAAREPWPDPPPPPPFEAPSTQPQPQTSDEVRDGIADAPVTPELATGESTPNEREPARLLHVADEEPCPQPPAAIEQEEDAPPPPLLDEASAEPILLHADAPAPEAPARAAADFAFDDAARTSGSSAPSAAALVGFERGGRAQVWERLRGDPRLYMAVGACGLVLFLCGLAGSLLGRPTAMGVAVGLVGVLCLAPAIAFFLHRRAPAA